MTKLKQFNKADLKAQIIKEYGSIPKLKKHLKRIAKNPYGCYTSEVQVYGCKIVYTSNPNCFAEYIINIPMVGFSGQYALGKESITLAGKQRGCFNENHFITL